MLTTLHQIGSYVASEDSVLWTPRGYVAGSKPGVIYCHGAGERATVPMNYGGNKPNEQALLQRICEAGYMVGTYDLGVFGAGGTTDSDSWGNTNAQTRVGQAITHIQAAGAKSGKVILLGISMGHVTAFNYAKSNPSNVQAVIGVIPVCDLDDIRDNNRNSYRASISTAWGTGAWTSAGTPALPAGANPATSNSGWSAKPWLGFYKSDDTIITASTVTALATAVGGTAVNMGTGGHTDASIGDVDLPTLFAFLAANS